MSTGYALTMAEEILNRHQRAQAARQTKGPGQHGVPLSREDEKALTRAAAKVAHADAARDSAMEARDQLIYEIQQKGVLPVRIAEALRTDDKPNGMDRGRVHRIIREQKNK